MTGTAGTGVGGGGGLAAVWTKIVTNMSAIEARALRGSGRWKLRGIVVQGKID